MTDHPIDFTCFTKYKGTRVQRFVFPIIPVNAILSPNSMLTQDHLGKIPGVYNPETGCWAGFKWQDNVTTEAMLQAWELWQAETGPFALGARTGEFISIDGDSDAAKYMAMVRELSFAHLGETPIIRRRDGSERAQFFYQHTPNTPPISKRKVKYRDENGAEHTVEVLGKGQQTVLEGPHAKGKMHYWETIGIAEGWDQMPAVTVDQADALIMAIVEESEKLGMTKVKVSLPSLNDRPAAVSITNTDSPHLAGDRDLLTRAIRAISLDDTSIEYDEFVNILRAICAAVGGDIQYLHEVVWPWVCESETVARGHSGLRTQDRGIEWLEARWRSFTDSQLGAEDVYGWAANFGFTEGNAAIVAELFRQEALANGNTDQAADGSGAGGDGSGSPPGAGGSSGPNGPLPPNDTHSALADAIEALYGDRRKFSAETKRWLEHEDAIWRICHGLLGDIEILARDLATQYRANPTIPRALDRARALESTGTHAAVRHALQGRRSMIVREKDFDADPRLLNTPDFVINLETGETMPHAPELLMRQMTLVTPDVMTFGYYEQSCPRFLQLVRILADGRDWVEPFLQRWFGYCLTGNIGHQHFLFIQGLPGTGKTQLITILNLLMGTYATTLRSVWMMKNTEKRFDMNKVVGKRMGFGDETQKGSTFDEERLSNVAGSHTLQAEIKGGDEYDFPNRLKLNLTGNHRPNFISGEAGGLMRRMLLLEVTSKPLAEIPGFEVQENFAADVVAAEGPAILMWAIQGAMLDYADKDHKIFNELKRPMVEATKTYSKENSLYWQWIESKMRLGPLDEVDIDLIEAYEQYKEYAYATTKVRMNDRRTDFKAALVAMLGNQIEFALRTKGQHKGRAIIKGLGYANSVESAGDNVVSLTALLEKRAEAADGEEKTSPSEV
jgi:putative DNA primase/helicase